MATQSLSAQGIFAEVVDPTARYHLEREQLNAILAEGPEIRHLLEVVRNSRNDGCFFDAQDGIEKAEQGGLQYALRVNFFSGPFSSRNFGFILGMNGDFTVNQKHNYNKRPPVATSSIREVVRLFDTWIEETGREYKSDFMDRVIAFQRQLRADMRARKAKPRPKQ